MHNEAIQKLIDAEKPAFDYARMFLTTIAWWSLLILIWTAMISSEKASDIARYIIMMPVFAVGALFGIFLLIRIGVLTERLSDVFLQQANKIPTYLRLPLIVIVSLVPPASAWLTVWAIMFSKVAS